MITAEQLVALSIWVDGGNAHRDSEAATWGRIAKVSEENGEAIAAYIGATGQNPRKGVTHTIDDVVKELLDVAVTALAAVEHLTQHDGRSMEMFARHLESLCRRAGITLPEAQEDLQIEMVDPLVLLQPIADARAKHQPVYFLVHPEDWFQARADMRHSDTETVVLAHQGVGRGMAMLVVGGSDMLEAAYTP